MSCCYISVLLNKCLVVKYSNCIYIKFVECLLNGLKFVSWISYKL